MKSVTGEPTPVGVLIANLGSPDAPTPEALRPYLKTFLSDPRVIEMNRALWWIILRAFVLTTRPQKSAELYRKIWWPEGSPLVVITKRQADGVRALLEKELGDAVRVAVGMRIGNPNVSGALKELRDAGCRRILVVPTFPQYSATTTASIFDGVTDELRSWRWIPELRTVHTYHDEPAYVDALAASVREYWNEHGEPAKLVMSFHGIPVRYAKAGDPYPHYCAETARLLAERLGLAEDRYVVCYQSRFGREEWLQPYTDETVKALARDGVAPVHVVAPAFAADCLETLEELDKLNREFFVEAGGRSADYHYIPALNDRPDHVRFLADLAKRHLAGWVD